MIILAKIPEIEPVAICICCGQNQWGPLGIIKRNDFIFQLCVCNSCGLIAQMPPLSSDKLSAYHAYGYNRKNYRANLPEIYRAMLRPSQLRLNYLAQQRVLKIGDRVLEIGPGAGSLMHLLAEQGFLVEGVEADGEAADWIHNRLRLPVQPGLFEEVYRRQKEKWQAEPFDLIVLVHVFEHILDPVRLLRMCAEILAEKGMIFLEVPNILKPFSDGYQWQNFCDPGHFYYYSPASLTKMVRKSGYQILDATSQTFKPYWNVWCLARLGEKAATTGYERSDSPVEIKKIWKSFVRFHGIKWLALYGWKRYVYLLLRSFNMEKEWLTSLLS